MLLAAGRGERLRPLTDDRPKCLLDVAGERIVERTIRLLAERGLTAITVVDGYGGDRLRAELGSRFPADWFRFVRNAEWAGTNNAWSLWLARESAEGPLLLLDSDIVFDAGVHDLLLADPHPNRLALRSRGGLGAEEMKVRLGAAGGVAAFGKEIPPDEAAGESLGLEVFSAAAADRLFAILDRRMRADGGRHEFYEAAFGELVEAGVPIWPVDIGDRRCVEIDTPEDLTRARALFG